MAKGEKRDSILPLEFNGKPIPWKAIVIILGLLGIGGGGLSQFNIATEPEVQEIVNVQTAKIREDIEKRDKIEDVRHVKIDDTFKKVIGTVEEIQTVQHKQFAREEARRLTEKIKDRNDRERTQFRLVDMNLSRLKNGREPCANIECTN